MEMNAREVLLKSMSRGTCAACGVCGECLTFEQQRDVNSGSGYQCVPRPAASRETQTLQTPCCFQFKHAAIRPQLSELSAGLGQ